MDSIVCIIEIKLMNQIFFIPILNTMENLFKYIDRFCDLFILQETELLRRHASW